MTPEEFRRYWEATYPVCPPVSYLLRRACGERWLRIHTLPAGKRYAESEAEYREVLHRHNTVLTDLIGEGEPFIFVSAGYAETLVPDLVRPEAAEHCPASRHFLTACMEDEPPRLYWHFFMDVQRWQPGMADPMLRQVADYAVANVAFVSVERQSIYAPYDGGADIVLSCASERATLRHRYADWLSTHPLGL